MNENDKMRDEFVMTQRFPLRYSIGHVPFSAGMLFFMMLVLYGCAAVKPGMNEASANKPVLSKATLTAGVRDDFEAAMVHIKAEEYDAGIELLNKVAKTVPAAPIPNINLALAYKKTGKMPQAEESLKLALTAESDHPVANNELALLYRKTGRFVEARQQYEKILEKYPNYRMVHKNLGILCDLYMKDYECALKHYVFYSDAVQDDKTVKIWIADLQKRAGR